MMDVMNETNAPGSNSLEVPSFCSEDLNSENCADWSSYESCLDPTECYAIQFHSNHQAFVEIVFGEDRIKPSVEEVCGKATIFVGNQAKCQTGAVEVIHSVLPGGL